MKKIALVTGGAGFIGSHVIDLLLKNKFKVKAIDNLSTGRINNLKNCFKNKNFSFKKFDITNLNLNNMYFKDVKYIFHFAGIADLVPSINDPEKYINVNFNGTLKVLQLAKKLKVKKFVYAASASCYGKTPNRPVKETDKISLEHPYALSKYLGEKACLHWAQVASHLQSISTLTWCWMSIASIMNGIPRNNNTNTPKRQKENGQSPHEMHWSLWATKDQPMLGGAVVMCMA